MTTTLFSAFSSSSPVSVSALGNATYVNNGRLQPGMNGSPRVGGHARHTPLPPLPAVGSGAPSSPASWPCPSLGHSRTSSFSSTSSSLLLTPPPGATLASFVGFGQRAQLSPPSPTRFSPTMSGSERDGEHVGNTERKYVLLRDPQGWYFNVPESALETSPDGAPRALPPAHHTRSPVRAPPSPRLLPAALPPSPAMPLVTVSSPQGTDALGLSMDAADDTRLWPSSSHASGTFVSGSSNRSPWSSPQNVSHSPLWGATGLPHPPRTSSLTQGLAVGLRVVESWSPSPARLGRSAPLQDCTGIMNSNLLARYCTYHPARAPVPAYLPHLPLEIPSAFESVYHPFARQPPTRPVVPPRISCYDENDEIITHRSKTINAAARIFSKFAAFLPTHRLGGGAVGRVVRVEHCRTGQPYALKVVHKGVAASRKFSRRNFLGERNVMLAVNESETAGRFLMSMLMCWEDVEKDLIFFVMPLYPADLVTVLLKKEEIPMASRYQMCKELICALVALFHLGVVHKDIKPANILIGHDGRAVLTDFGNAAAVPTHDYATWKGYVRDGTYCYMAPEMVSADAKMVGYGTNVDVFSLGLVIMEIIGFCDGPFFHQRSLIGVRDEHANSGRLPIDPNKFLCTEEKFWEILPAMLQVDPEKRITAPQLEDKYVCSEEWTAVRDGSATHDWRPTVTLPVADVKDAARFLDFSLYSHARNHYGVDPLEFEYCVPGVF